MMTEVLRDRRVQVSELELHYVEGPDAGPPIVFMHGITARWQACASVIPAFLEAWHVFAVDLRGSGESGWTPGEYGFAGPARDIAEFLRDVILQPAVLVGHSWGAVTAAQVAADAPHAVRAIVLEDPPLYPQSESALAPFRALDTLLRGQPTAGALEDAVRQQMPQASATDVAERTASLAVLDPTILTVTLTGARRYESLAIEDLLPRIGCPTLLLHGDRDFPGRPSVLTAENVAQVGRQIPRCTVRHIGDAGHLIHTAQRDRFLGEVTEFLATLEYRPRPNRCRSYGAGPMSRVFSNQCCAYRSSLNGATSV